MEYVEHLRKIPQDLVAVADYEYYAKRYIPMPIYEYIVGGAGDESSLRRNREKFNEWMILPRALRDSSKGGTHTSILGENLRHPIMLAPVAFQKLVHPEGELATAEAASILETAMVACTLSSVSLEEIAQRLRSPKWFQLDIQEDRDFTLSLVRRAEDAGYSKLVITVDAALQGILNRAQRAAFKLPDEIEAVNLRDCPELPHKALEPGDSMIFQGIMSEAPHWDMIHWLQEQTELPIILKGLLNPADVRMAQSLDIAGVMVSNHGGRALDCVPSAIEMLPLIRQAVGENYPLLLDGGIQRGTDVFKALALGANAVLVGRPQLYALAVAGPLGVAHMLRILREELEVCMALAGTPSIADISANALYR